MVPLQGGHPRGKRKREAGERHEFQVVHIARAGRKAMERMAGLPRGDG